MTLIMVLPLSSSTLNDKSRCTLRMISLISVTASVISAESDTWAGNSLPLDGETSPLSTGALATSGFVTCPELLAGVNALIDAMLEISLAMLLLRLKRRLAPGMVPVSHLPVTEVTPEHSAVEHWPGPGSQYRPAAESDYASARQSRPRNPHREYVSVPPTGSRR